MFTGIVREVGRLKSVRARGGITRLEIDAPDLAGQFRVGDSLAVNGICLTVTRLRGPRIGADATAETRRITTLPFWRAGESVHLETALRAGEPLGGHFVLGHVDGTGRVMGLTRRGGAVAMTVEVSAALAARLLPKGSIAVDGVSLTLDEGPFPGRFTVTLIPHTLAATRFKSVKVGELVNIEVDVLAKAAASGPEAQGRTGLTSCGAGLQAHAGRAEALPHIGLGPARKDGASLTVPSILARGWERRRAADREPRGRR